MLLTTYINDSFSAHALTTLIPTFTAINTAAADSAICERNIYAYMCVRVRICMCIDMKSIFPNIFQIGSYTTL